MAGLLVADVDDRVILARLDALATRRGLPLVRIDQLDSTPNGETPVAVVVELDSPDAVERLSAYRRRWPAALLAGSIGVPDQERWHGALAAGADLVANRGAFVVSSSARWMRVPAGSARTRRSPVWRSG